MQKNFDRWNTIKQKTNYERARFYTVRELWWARVGVNIGTEQDGSGSQFLRPVLVLRAFGPDTCLIVPCTSSPKKHPLRIPIGEVKGKEASALISQIRTIDTRRLSEKIGFLEKQQFVKIQNAIRNFF